MTLQRQALVSPETRLDRLHGKLSDAVAALVTGEDWTQALMFAMQFRSQSFNNMMLIYAQHAAAHDEGRVPNPIPTYVAGSREWRSLGRHVEKGQHGYGVLTPVTATFVSSNPADPESWHRLRRGEQPGPSESVRSKLIGLKPTRVWDVSQTAGDRVAAPPTPQLLRGQAPARVWDGLAAQIAAAGFELRRVSSAAAIGGANGLTDFLVRRVSIRADMDPAAQAKTLAHELGHVLLHGPRVNPLSTDLATDATLHRGVAEVEAESVAYLVAATHGLDMSTYTMPHVSTWAASITGRSPVEVIQATAETVRRTALGILEKLDTDDSATATLSASTARR